MKNIFCSSIAALACMVILNVNGCSILRPSQQDLSGTWKGFIITPLEGKMRVQVNISKNPDGTLSGTADSPDQDTYGFPIDTISIDKDMFRFEIQSIRGVYEGEIVNGGKTIEGEWRQDGETHTLILQKD